ncbi:MAG: membrane metalloprotease [Pricia sp.]|nr:membrane metalloprotease [Pricia sp.]
MTDDDGNPQEVDITANQKSVGDSANNLLSSQNFDSIVFELFYVEGLEPNENTIANFESFLNDRLNKPSGVNIELFEIDSPGQSVYTIEDIRNLEDNIRTAYNKDKKIAVFGIFIDGEYSENTEDGSVLGVAYRNTSFAIFEETVQSFSGQPFAPSTEVLETTVLNHEFGHLMGMVNAGTPLQSEHQDTEHGRHCTDEDCLMYWTAETGEGLVNMISGGSIPDFDSQCVTDLQANGGK